MVWWITNSLFFCVCLLPCYSAVNGSFVQLCTSFFGKKFWAAEIFGAFLTFFFWKPVFWFLPCCEPSSPVVQLRDQNAPACSVLAVLTAEAHCNADRFDCQSDTSAGGPGVGSDRLDSPAAFWASVVALALSWQLWLQPAPLCQHGSYPLLPSQRREKTLAVNRLNR